VFEAIKNKGVPVVESEGLIKAPVSVSPMIIPIVIKR